MGRVETGKIGEKVLLMGNEALARGAIEGGVQLAVAYPGTPSSEIVETLIKQAKQYNYYVEWSTNEKVAFDMAAGASILGARSLVSMKNAGINVAMDTLLTLNLGGIKGGMVVIVCDDPSAHYSSNEQDSRFAALAAELPCFEPKDQQEAKDMVRDAFELSEKLELPVLVRSVSRISHGNGDVLLGEINPKNNPLGFNKHWKMPWRWNVYGPPGVVEKHKWIHERLKEAEDYSEKTRYNELVSTGDKSRVGIIASGLASSYVKEALSDIEHDFDVLYLGLSFPVPKDKVSHLLSAVDKVLVVEEGGGYCVESKVRAIAQEGGFTTKVHGKEYNQLLMPYGELNTALVRKAVHELIGIGQPFSPTPERRALKDKVKELVAPRSSTLCAGCPHLGSYSALKKLIRKNKGINIVNVDIGCYEQAGYGLFSSEPEASDDQAKKYKIKSTYETLDTCYVMGSSLAMAEGQQKVGYNDGKLFAVAGDSTFFHSLMPAVVNGIYNNSDVTLLILDNKWTAMTGHQPNPASGYSSKGEPTDAIDIVEVVKAMGASFVREANAFALKELESVIEQAANYKGFAVVVIRGECRLQYVRRTPKNAIDFVSVNSDTCTGCKLCIDLGCPALGFDETKNTAWIDPIMCNGCDICTQICPSGSIILNGGEKHGNS